MQEYSEISYVYIIFFFLFSTISVVAFCDLPGFINASPPPSYAKKKKRTSVHTSFNNIIIKGGNMTENTTVLTRPMIISIIDKTLSFADHRAPPSSFPGR